MTSRDLSDGALGRQDGLVRDEPIISTEAEDGLSLENRAVIEREFGPIAKNGIPVGAKALNRLLNAARTQAHAPAGGAPLPQVERVECVTYEKGYEEEAPPFWRLNVGGYCADFETETAAANFRHAILALASTPPAHPEAVERWVCAECDFEGVEADAHKERDWCGICCCDAPSSAKVCPGCGQDSLCSACPKCCASYYAHPAPAVAEGDMASRDHAHTGSIALEFGAYLADAADAYCDFLATQESEVDHDARADLFKGLRSAAYEFRKRLPSSAKPADGDSSRDALTPPPGDQEEVRKDWVLVPREPTEAMCDAAARHEEGTGYDTIYRTMLSASPSPPSGDREAVAGVIREHELAAYNRAVDKAAAEILALTPPTSGGEA